MLVFGFLGLAKASSDHHLYHASAKEYTAGLNNIKRWFPWGTYFLIHLASRIGSLAFLISENTFFTKADGIIGVATLASVSLSCYLMTVSKQKGLLPRVEDVIGTFVMILKGFSISININYEHGSRGWAIKAWQIHKFNCLAIAMILTVTTIILNSLWASDVITASSYIKRYGNDSWLEIYNATYYNTSHLLEQLELTYNKSALDLGLPPLHPKMMANEGLIWIAVTVLFNVASIVCLHKWGYDWYTKMELDGKEKRQMSEFVEIELLERRYESNETEAGNSRRVSLTSDLATTRVMSNKLFILLQATS